VTVSPVKTTGQKAIVPRAMKNGLSERIESAHAVCFLFDDQGKMVGQATKWVIGGADNKGGLAPGATSTFNSVVAVPRPLPSTNLTPSVSFNRSNTRLAQDGDCGERRRVWHAAAAVRAFATP
jgi:hypothetical protein